MDILKVNDHFEPLGMGQYTEQSFTKQYTCGLKELIYIYR